jgi:S1-C subfamily serine protease
MKPTLFLASLALALSGGSLTGAKAEDWITSATGDASAYFTDLSTLSRTGDVVQSWMREDLNRPAKDKRSGSSYSHIFTQRYDDCAAHRFSFAGAVTRNDRGEVVATYTNPGGWQAMVPGSVAEAIWRVSCAATTQPREKPILDDISAGSWTSIGVSADSKYLIYVALDRVARLDTEHVLVVTRSDFAKPEWNDGIPIRHLVNAAVIDCVNRKMASVATDYFISSTIRVRAYRAPGLGFESIAPGSFAFANFDRICSSAVSRSASEDGREEGGGAYSGTAWMVTKGYLVTADHVVAGAKSLVVYSNGEKVGRAEVVSEDAANDLAVLRPVGWPKKTSIALPLAPRGVPLGKRIFTLGYPEPDTLGQHIKMAAGEVSGTNGPHDDAHDLQISIPIQPGNSGGPVLTFEGTVVGIVNSKLTKFGADDDQPKPELVNYAVKAAYLRPMLEDLPDLANYRVLGTKGGADQIVADARRSVFMVVATQ